MKLSLAWLRELIDIPSHLTAAEIGDKLTLHTSELEEIIDRSDVFDHVVAGELVEVKPHPKSEKLSIGIFNCGKHGNPRQVLFGKVHVLHIEKVYPIALPGLSLGNGVEVKEAEMGGVLSAGMVIDNQELGMKNTGLLEFTKADTGKKLSGINIMFADKLFDIDNKSLTHRPDLMGHMGFARELGAIFDLPFSYDYQADKLTELNSTKLRPLKVDIQTPNCRRFTGVKMTGIRVAPTALKEAMLLENLGTRSISNIVDITNLVMLKHGQPMHAFDANKISGTIIVRQAKAGEKLIALDENEYELTPDDMVIADEEKVLSIAGVMGGLESAVTDSTTEIIFECANFCPTCIRKTSQRLGLRSESSMRYEKSLDAENCNNGLAEAVAIAKRFCPDAELASGVADEYPLKNKTTTVILDPVKARRLSGISLSIDEIQEILTQLGFGVVKTVGIDHKVLEVTIPSFRATKDVGIPEDLIEEVVRMHGYHHVPALLPDQPVVPPRRNQLRELEWQVRDTMSMQGYLEIIHSSFCAPTDNEWLETDNYVEMINAPTAETRYMRQSLCSNFVRHLESELRTHGQLQAFEIGKVYQATDNKATPYCEERRLGIFSARIGGKSRDLFYELKMSVEKFLTSLGINADQVDFRPVDIADDIIIFHPYQTANIFVNDIFLGVLGAINPTKHDVKHGVVAMGELNLETLKEIVQNLATTEYQISSPYPAIHRDLSIIVHRKTLTADINKTMQRSAKNLKSIHFFDEYIDEKRFGIDLKNLAFHLDFQCSASTLSAEEVQQDFDQITKALADKFGAQLRVDFEASSQ